MYFRNWNLRRRYGITHQQYETMLAAQGGVCAICGSGEPGANKKFFSVDHDHKTGKLRSLLCDFCNNGLAKFKERPDVLRLAAEYLERHSG